MDSANRSKDFFDGFKQELAALGIADYRRVKEDKERYAAALPVVLKWLHRLPRDNFRWELVGILESPLATPTARALAQEFREAPNDDSYRWSVGSALELAADDSVASDIAELAGDTRYGRSRQRLLPLLGRLRPSRSFDILAAALNDPTLAGHAVEGFGLLGDPRAIPLLEPFLQHKMSWIRAAAKKKQLAGCKRRQSPHPGFPRRRRSRARSSSTSQRIRMTSKPTFATRAPCSYSGASHRSKPNSSSIS